MVENFHILVGSLRIFLLAFIAHKCLQLSLKNAKQSTILLTFVHEGQKMFSNDDLNLFSVFRLYLFSLDFRFVIQLVAPIPVFFRAVSFLYKNVCVSGWFRQGWRRRGLFWGSVWLQPVSQLQHEQSREGRLFRCHPVHHLHVLLPNSQW